MEPRIEPDASAVSRLSTFDEPMAVWAIVIAVVLILALIRRGFRGLVITAGN